MPKLGSSLTEAELARLNSEEAEMGMGAEDTYASNEEEDDSEDQEEDSARPTASSGNTMYLLTNFRLPIPDNNFYVLSVLVCK